jgi:hypothetical protein
MIGKSNNEQFPNTVGAFQKKKGKTLVNFFNLGEPENSFTGPTSPPSWSGRVYATTIFSFIYETIYIRRKTETQ